MRINLYSFLDPFVYGGGGEQIVRQLVVQGREHGHDIRVMSVRPNRGRDQLHASPDLVIVNDVFNHGHSWKSLGAWRGFAPGLLQEIVQDGRFIHMNNAYVDVCNLPYMPCSGQRQGGCDHKSDLSWARQLLLRDGSGDCFAARQLVAQLHTRSLVDVFLSPLHLRMAEQVLGTKLPQGWVLPPLIDTKVFSNGGRERDIDYLFVGVIGEAKGLAEIRQRFGDKNITLVGRCAPGAVVDFGTHVPHVPYDQVPVWMNRAKHFVFLPRWPEPQGRVVCEAALCGCTIIGNDRVGALSFDFDLADPSRYQQPDGGFWARVTP